MLMRVGYCRVSTQKAEQDISIEGQQQQLLAAGCDEVIIERASAFKGQRKGWTRLWALVRGHAGRGSFSGCSRYLRTQAD